MIPGRFTDLPDSRARGVRGHGYKHLTRVCGILGIAKTQGPVRALIITASLQVVHPSRPIRADQQRPKTSQIRALATELKTARTQNSKR